MLALVTVTLGVPVARRRSRAALLCSDSAPPRGIARPLAAAAAALRAQPSRRGTRLLILQSIGVKIDWAEPSPPPSPPS